MNVTHAITLYSLGKLRLPEIFGLLTGVTGIHGFLASAPVGWADLTVLLHVLECFHESQSFFWVTTYW